MIGWLYLIRNRDLYKIGVTKNLEIRMRQLKPDSIVSILYTKDFLKLERELHTRYKKFRIPQTEYFRLQKFHLKEIKQRIFKDDYPMSMIVWVFIRSLIFILLLSFLMFLFISLNFNNINIIILNSLLWMERISFGFSFISIFVNSGKYFSFLSEFKYRLSKLIIFIIFAFSFKIASILLQ